MDISYINDLFNGDSLSRNKHLNNIENIIIFDHTDNKKARESIEEFYKKENKNSVLISTGNEEDFGQVLVSCNNESGYYEKRDDYFKSLFIKGYCSIKSQIIKNDPKNKTVLSHTPTLLDLYRNLTDTVKPSCADVTLIDDQSMPINSLVAQLAYNVFYTIISGQSLNYYMVKCNINNTYSTKYISHPIDALDMYVQGILGEVTDESRNDLSLCYEFLKNPTNAEDIINKLSDKYYDFIYNNILFQSVVHIYGDTHKLEELYKKRKESDKKE